ncbi:MAG: four helix bundle protein [Verrucomicrobiaceae bacterium]
MPYQSFEELEVWKRACRQSVNIYKLVKGTNDYGLKSQIERSGVSVPSNIAEGCERDSAGDYIRFLRIAKGSNAELRTQLYLAQQLQLADSSTIKPLVAENKEISAMLQGLIRSLEKPSK